MRNRPQTPPVQVAVRLQPLIASQIQPKQTSVTGFSLNKAKEDNEIILLIKKKNNNNNNNQLVIDKF